MDGPLPPASESADAKPRKIRTWWHPLLANMLRWQLGDQYQLDEEVMVGKMPMQIDLLILRKQQGDLPRQARLILAGLADYLNDITLLELKGPSETLRPSDFHTLLAYALLYRGQNNPLLAPDKLNVLVMAPRLTKPYKKEMRALGVTPRQEKAGIWALEGNVVIHRTWLLETETLYGMDHPLLTLFSPQFLSEGPRTYAQLREGGYTELVVYLSQQIQQFQKKGAEFAMQHLGTEEEMEQALRDLIASFPPEQRLEGLGPAQRLAGMDLREIVATLPPEDRVAGLSPKDRIAGLPPEDRVAGLSPKERIAGLSPEDRIAGLPPEDRVAGLSLKERIAGLSSVEKEALRKQLEDDPFTPSE